ncbi:MAG: linear amide C-N hydrolase [Bacteroidales bacterium]|nr:linear amide C-N hydrolase [Bacteroidales bacterium]
MKKAIKIILWSLLILTVVILAGAWSIFGDLVNGARSVQKLDDKLYYMEYEGDDGFDELMAGGGIKNATDLSIALSKFLSKGYYDPSATPDSMNFGCSTLTARTPDGHVLMGRNFDYPSATAMILHCKPTRGYESISTFNVEFLGFGDGWQPEGFKNQYMALSCLFVALDGINEKGFAIADLMAGDDVVTDQNTGKPNLTTTAAIAYLLKNASSVDEAVKLLSNIDMHSDIGAAHHYAMSDASGRSVVVEYVDNEMVVTETRAVTNHYLCEQKLGAGLVEGDNRYEKLCSAYDDAQGVMDTPQFSETVFSVAQEPWGESRIGGTLWTMIMDLTNPSVTYYSQRQFDKPFKFEIGK